jgi:Biotin carboxylase C-terminal domain
VHAEVGCRLAAPFPRQASQLHGWALECRVYAEDPSRGYLPSTGLLRKYVEPRGEGVRVDSGAQRRSHSAKTLGPPDPGAARALGAPSRSVCLAVCLSVARGLATTHHWKRNPYGGRQAGALSVSCCACQAGTQVSVSCSLQ